MSAFDIAPHSRRGIRLAMGFLALAAGAAFAEGFVRQLMTDTPPPPPRAMPGDAAIAEATPAPPPTLQAPAQPKPRRAAVVDDEAPALDAPAAADSPAASPPAPVAADAAATAPDASTQPPAPTPSTKSDEAPT
jgi:hypothetical protein